MLDFLLAPNKCSCNSYTTIIPDIYVYLQKRLKRNILKQAWTWFLYSFIYTLQSLFSTMRTDYSCNEMLINKWKVAELLQRAFPSFTHRKLIKMALLWLSFLSTIQIADRNSWTKFPKEAVYWLKLTPIDTQGKHPNLGSTLKNEIMLCFTYKWCSTMERRLRDRNSVPDAGRGEAGRGRYEFNPEHVPRWDFCG